MILDLIVMAIGTGAILVGLAAIIAPGKASDLFGVPAQDSARTYVRGLGIRDSFMGLSLWLGYWRGDHMLLSGLFLGIAIVSMVDFWMVRAYGSKIISWTHAGGIVVGMIVAALLFLN